MRTKKLKTKKFFALLLSLFIVMMTVPISASATEMGEISLETTLTDGVTFKGSRKTFDVIARLNGEKIKSEVTLNGEEVKYNWDDKYKTSYTLNFKQEGKNTVIVKASSGNKMASKTYTIIYKKAVKGELIGHATWTIEALTIGRGFIIEPIQFPIYEGENAAQALDRILTENGYSYNCTGKLENSFYLSMIGDGGVLKCGCQDKDKAQVLNAPVDIEDKVPEVLKKALNDEGDWPPDKLFDPECLGEFDYTYMSGWMYAVNNVFPNVGFSDSYLTDGDVIRVQFTLFGYGSDIGGSYAMGGGNTDFYEVANKDQLMPLLASINSSKDKEEILGKHWVKAAYDEGMKVAVQVDATQKTVDEVYSKLDLALKRIPLTNIYLNKTSITLDKNTEENLVVGYKEENTTDDKTVEWTTSDAAVATVENGKVTALKAGTAFITAKVGTLTATCKVTVPELSTKPMINEDKVTGIKIEVPANVLPVDTKLIVVPVMESNVNDFKQVKTSLKGISEKFTAFDILLQSQEGSVQPKGNVKVTLPIPKGYDHSQIIVYRILEDGTLKDMQATISDDRASFETDHFSLYAIVQKNVVPEKPIETVDPKETPKEANTEKPSMDREKPSVNKGETSIDIAENSLNTEEAPNKVNTTEISKESDAIDAPKTGDNSHIIFTSISFIMASVTLVVLTVLKRKRYDA